MREWSREVKQGRTFNTEKRSRQAIVLMADRYRLNPERRMPNA
jgi:hypothetical protein